jgi:methylglyoxal synthase
MIRWIRQTETNIVELMKTYHISGNQTKAKNGASWALKHRTRLIEHELYATAHTADIIAEVLNAPVFRFLSGPLGGDQQIGSRIAESRIDVLIFFWDPLGHQPHDSDVKALLRLATAWNIPNACNEATADCIISSPLFEAEPQAVSESPNQKSAADVAPVWTRITAIRTKKVNLSKTSLYWRLGIVEGAPRCRGS